jgi:hypothetical protein
MIDGVVMRSRYEMQTQQWRDLSSHLIQMWTSIEALVLACWCNLMIATDGESFVAETLAFTVWGLFSQSFCDPANQVRSLMLVPETPAITTGLSKYTFNLICQERLTVMPRTVSFH